MSQDIRNKIIEVNVPKLIASILGQQCNEDNFRTCENFVWHQIKHNCYPSISSHAVTRDIDALSERFKLENLPRFGDYVNKICTELVEHPVCKNHYELDIQWSAIDFLIRLAHQPIASVRRDKFNKELHCKHVLNILESGGVKPPTRNLKLKISNEKSTDIVPYTRYFKEDDMLSVWSDDCISLPRKTTKEESENFISADLKLAAVSPITEPPKSQTQFETYYDISNLIRFVQINWWRHDVFIYTQIESRSIFANFAIAYAQWLKKTGLIALQYNFPSTISQHCLLREVVLMFFAPTNCKFFSITKTDIKVRENVTIPSVTVHTLQLYLSDIVLKPIIMFRTIIEIINVCEHDLHSSRTLMSFATSVRSLLEPITNDLITYERRLLEEQNNEVNTLSTFHQHMRKSFKELKLLHSIIRYIELPISNMPIFIKSMYLLVKLYSFINNDSNNIMAIVLFLSTFKAYCGMMDSWFHKGTLNDWRQEFLVEQSYNVKNIFVLRKLQAKDVTEDIAQIIKKSPLYKLLSAHAIEYVSTQGLLVETNRIYDMITMTSHSSLKQTLYNELLNVILSHSGEVSITTLELKKKQSNASQHLLNKTTATQDKHLLGVFFSNMKSKNTEVNNTTNYNINAHDMLECLENDKIIPPIRPIFNETLKNMLKSRFDFVSEFTMRIYKDDLNIGLHLKHIRNVIMLQDSTFMYTFCCKLFERIESGLPWANGALLSLQLDNLIATGFSEKPAYIRIDIRSTIEPYTDKVYHAANEISMIYELNSSLERVITFESIMKYNDIFRMMLKVKWAIWKLEQLHFPKKRVHDLYASLKMVDVIMRRLMHLRFWLMQQMNTLHFYLVINVLLPLANTFDKALILCKHFKDLQKLHQSYLKTMCEMCFATEHFENFRIALDQLFHLIYVMQLEWQSCISYVDETYSLRLDNPTNEGNSTSDYLQYNHIDDIEDTYQRIQSRIWLELNEKCKEHKNLIGLRNIFSKESLF